MNQEGTDKVYEIMNDAGNSMDGRTPESYTTP